MDEEALPKCGGTGKVKASVTIEWVPDGKMKDCLKEEVRHDIP